MSLSRPRRSRPVWLNVLCGVIALAIAGTLVAALVFMANGGRWFVIATSSMGTTAPVGTLVFSMPTTVAELHTGDIISFHPPTAPTETYTHRVVKITSDGGIITRGDINGSADGWLVHQADIIGQAALILPGVGWLVRGLPILLLGLAIVFLLTGFVRSLQRRAAFRIVGATLVFSIAAVILRPFTGVAVLQTSMDKNHVLARVVSTGLLPIRVKAKDGSAVNLLSGETGIVSIPTSLTHNYYAMDSALHLDFWGWVVFALVCCLPLALVLIFGLPPKEFSELDDRTPKAQHNRQFIEDRRSERQRYGVKQFA